MGKPESTPVVLAIAPVSRGIGFAIFEGPKIPIDWGVKGARIQKEETCQRHVESLISFYQPDILVLERFDDDTNRARVAALNDKLSVLGSYTAVEVVRLHRDNIQAVFSEFGAKTKFGIAKTIAGWLPEMGLQMPRYRKPWMNEDHSMAMFEAAALALSYYYINC